jgi:hypothetical protein
MAICRPKVIAAAPVFGPERSGGWQRPDFLGSRGMGEAQGKKVALPPLRPGDRGAAVLWPDQAIEAVWLAGPAALKEKTWRKSSDPRKRRTSRGEEKETRACRSADHDRPGPGSADPRADCVECVEIRCRRSASGTNAEITRRDQRDRSDQVVTCRNVPPTSAGAKSAMRAQAVTAAMIAPTTAIASRHPSPGTTMYARPSAA